jgi:aspartyl-tRNA(Asn)/glutamyl-tRNA(Gln) amidotransferase subunit C
VALTRDDVRRLARLARLDLSPGDEERLLADLQAILAYMEIIRSLDVAGLEPMTHGDEGASALRADDTVPGLARETALDGAPETADGCFVVPRVVRPEA